MADPVSPPVAPSKGPKITARALMIGDRLDVAGLERSDVLSTSPLAFRAGSEGFVALFRFGVVVLVGLSPLEEDEVIRGLRQRTSGEFARHEEETAIIEISPDREDQIPPGGPIYLKELSTERLIVIADALSKSAALARDEHEAAAFFDVVDPFARHLAEKGRRPGNRREILKHVGNALLVRQRISGRVAVEEKPDVLWDRPDLERLYARLEDEYELKERAVSLHRKLDVIGDTAQALTDLIDTERSLRLELIIVLLIVFEIFITFYQMFTGGSGH
ncbi:RMD1 family protein [Microvirga pudoricolor]|uniref:RMD1 family protein n=1 Tax=Microvirga pudoricolor TaxID=2778729 RepID=UPI0019510796|nr:RMD1 family protein [Microvirga pudoricolor]MBM6594537.1 RMD1 family protein [Microvirga pudoricolor]